MKNHTITRSGEIKPAPPFIPAKPFGLGDAVATIAQPIARTIDAVLGTKISQCGGCKARQAALNAAIPNIFPGKKPDVSGVTTDKNGA
jgi:hypothetical protein